MFWCSLDFSTRRVQNSQFPCINTAWKETVGTEYSVIQGELRNTKLWLAVWIFIGYHSKLKALRFSYYFHEIDWALPRNIITCRDGSYSLQYEQSLLSAIDEQTPRLHLVPLRRKIALVSSPIVLRVIRQSMLLQRLLFWDIVPWQLEYEQSISI